MKILKSYLTYINEDYNFAFILNEISGKYFEPYPFLSLDLNLEGYRVNVGKISIGGRIAMQINNVTAIRDGLFHEMGHFVYVENFERLLISNFGLDYTTTVTVFDKVYREPITYQGVKNEIKAVLWQSVIAKEYLPMFNTYKFVEALKYMNDFYNVPLFNCFYYRGEDVKKKYKWFYDSNFETEVPFKEVEKLRIKTLHNIVDKELQNPIYTITNFDKRWLDRVDYIQKNIEQN